MPELLPESIIKQQQNSVKAEKEGRYRKYRNKEGKLVKVKIKAIPLAELQARWKKKKEHLEKLAGNIRSLRYNLTRDLKSNDEKTRLTALVISLMDCTAERVGNQDSAESGHFGVTGFQKKHVTVIGNKIHLSYRGKSGVDHEKSFSDKLIAQTLKRSIKDSPGKFVFTTSDGFRIHADRVNRYLKEYHITAKDIRGYCANTYVINKLKKEAPSLPLTATADLPKDKLEKKRKSLFNKSVKWASTKVGHGVATLKNHYLMPEVGIAYIQRGEIINLIDFYSNGGDVSNDNSKDAIHRVSGNDKPKHVCPCTRPVGFKKKNNVKRFSKGGKLTKNSKLLTLLAPNGKPSNLNAKQYALVRTPEFKAWFGDWQNDPENSSKVVDENGEPKVVYHGTYKKFTIFETNDGQIRNVNSGGWGSSVEWEEVGAFFTDSEETAQVYAMFGKKGKVIKCFLNIRNPLTKGHEQDKQSWTKIIPNIFNSGYGKNNRYDGFIVKGVYETQNEQGKIYQTTYNVKRPNQIKLADGTNTTFDSGSDDIRFEEGGHIGDAPMTNAPMTNDTMTNDPSIGRKLSYLYTKLWSHNNNLVAYAQHISKMLLAGHQFKSKVEHEKIAKTYGIQHADIAKEWAEYAVVLTARNIVSAVTLSGVEGARERAKQTFEKLTDLYARQPSLTHRTSTTITKQQYSTPAPIAYLMSYWAISRESISLEKGAEGGAPEGLFFEPTAGTGLLTIAAPTENWVVNEIDKTRLDILRLQGFASVLSQDATNKITFPKGVLARSDCPLPLPLPSATACKAFSAIVANPPFGNTHSIKYSTFTLTGLEQLISARALEYMKDDGKCALIIGGNTEYDERGRIKSKKDLVFFNYLAKHYNLVDVINISPELFRRQGAVYPTRIILISGTQSGGNTYYPLADFKADNTTKFSTKAVDNLPTLYSRILGE